MKYALLGEKLGHSLSPQLHALLGKCEYELLELPSEELPVALKNTTYDGFNLTIPYKKTVLPYLNEVDEKAKLIGSVNTVVRLPGNQLKGYNTDYYGLSRLLDLTGVDLKGKKVLVLGSGGTSATACTLLSERQARTVVISRTGRDNYQNLERHADATAIVNTTPVGMFPNSDACLIELRLFPELEAVIDVIYNPLRTVLFQQAEKLGIKAVCGLPMLVRQAAFARALWEGKRESDYPEQEALHILRLQNQNLVLMGMPGCGKTTIGKRIADCLQRPFIDLDALISQEAGCSIPQIFSEHGEAYFRALEKKAVMEVSGIHGAVIAMGGGTPLDSDNVMRLKQNGYILWIQRPLNQLPTDGRPLSQSNSLQALWEKRYPVYTAACDAQASNGSTIEACCEEAIAKWRSQNEAVGD